MTKQGARPGHGSSLPVRLRNTVPFSSGSYLFIYSLLHSKFIQCLLSGVQSNINCLFHRVQTDLTKILPLLPTSYLIL